MLSKLVSSIIIWVFGMTWPGIEPQSPGQLVNTLLIRPMAWCQIEKQSDCLKETVFTHIKWLVLIFSLLILISDYIDTYIIFGLHCLQIFSKYWFLETGMSESSTRTTALKRYINILARGQVRIGSFLLVPCNEMQSVTCYLERSWASQNNLFILSLSWSESLGLHLCLSVSFFFHLNIFFSIHWRIHNPKLTLWSHSFLKW